MPADAAVSLVIDAQVHTWDAGQPPANHTQRTSYSEDDLLADMAAAGVDAAILVPPTWDPNGDAPALRAAQRHPDRFAVMGHVHFDHPMTASELADWAAQPGMIGVRMSFNRPDARARLIDGSADWLWRSAAEADVPVAILIPGLLPWGAELAQRYPSLRIIVDHLAIPRGSKGAKAFEHWPELLAIARFPNVAVKACGLPSYALDETYPYPALHAPVKAAIEAFGPERVFWGTDLSRMPGPYREAVTMVTEAMPLTADERRLVMGSGLARWLRWTPGA